MDHRRLGAGGLTVKAITYGDWLTIRTRRRRTRGSAWPRRRTRGSPRSAVDDVHGDLVERDPTKIATPFDVMPAWKS
jgi:hypothetical protein